MHSPSGASIPACEKTTWLRGWWMTLTPPASAMEHSPRRSASTARWRVTSEEEQAVSTVRLGPRQPRTYETRPDTALLAAPVPV